MEPQASFRLLSSLLLLLAGLASISSNAQSPAPLSTPNVKLNAAGQVFTSVALSDGSLIIGGTFQSLNGVGRSNIAKVSPAGSLDPTWTTAVGKQNDVVYAIAVDGSGNIYIGGSFASVNGSAKQALVRLHADGTLDNTWNPLIYQQGLVRALALDGDGNLFVGGNFGIDTRIGTFHNLAKVSTAGAGDVDTTWIPGETTFAPVVNSLIYDGASSLYVGGSYTSIGGLGRPGLARISSNGAGDADPTWDPNADIQASVTSVDSLALIGSSLFVGGQFTHIGGQARNGIAKFSTSGLGNADATWNPNPHYLAKAGNVESLALDDSGHIYVGGKFTDIGGHSLTNVAKLSTGTTGASVATWNPAANSPVLSLAIAPSGNVYAGGVFDTIGAALHLALAQIDTAGNIVTPTPDVEIPGQVLAISPVSDGSAIAGGFFQKVNGGLATRRNILRIKADGTLDSTWDAEADQRVETLAADGAGSVYVGGAFAHIGGLARNSLAKLSTSGTGAADATWNPGADSDVAAVILDGAGNAYAGGSFATIGGLARPGLARLSATGTGTVDATWNPLAGIDPGYSVHRLVLDGSNVYAGGEFYFIDVNTNEHDYLGKFSTSGAGAGDPDWNPSPFTFNFFVVPAAVNVLWPDGSGSIYVGGVFDTIGGQNRGNIAKLSTTGTGDADATWNPSADGQVDTLLPDGAGNFYLGGGFANIGGQARNNIAKVSLTGTGTADSMWNPSADGEVQVITKDISGRILVGGGFAEIGTEQRGGLAKFAADVLFSNGFD